MFKSSLRLKFFIVTVKSFIFYRIYQSQSFGIWELWCIVIYCIVSVRSGCSTTWEENSLVISLELGGSIQLTSFSALLNTNNSEMRICFSRVFLRTSSHVDTFLLSQNFHFYFKSPPFGKLLKLVCIETESGEICNNIMKNQKLFSASLETTRKTC